MLEVRSGVLDHNFVSSVRDNFFPSIHSFAGVSVTIWLFPVLDFFILTRLFSRWNFWTWSHHFWSGYLFFNVQLTIYDNSFNLNRPLTIESTTVTFNDDDKLFNASSSFSSRA